MYQRHLMVSIAVDVVCPIKVLKAKLAIVAIDTPFARVLVSKISAGMIQLSGPHVALNEKLNSHIIAMKPHAACPFWVCSGAKVASRAVATMNVTIFPRFPKMSGHRLPSRSMNTMQQSWANKAITEL